MSGRDSTGEDGEIQGAQDDQSFPGIFSPVRRSDREANSMEEEEGTSGEIQPLLLRSGSAPSAFMTTQGVRINPLSADYTFNPHRPPSPPLPQTLIGWAQRQKKKSPAEKEKFSVKTPQPPASLASLFGKSGSLGKFIGAEERTHSASDDGASQRSHSLHDGSRTNSVSNEDSEQYPYKRRSQPSYSNRKPMMVAGPAVIRKRKVRLLQLEDSKPPPYDPGDVEKFGPIIEKSWKDSLDALGFSDMGDMFFEELLQGGWLRLWKDPDDAMPGSPCLHAWQQNSQEEEGSDEEGKGRGEGHGGGDTGRGGGQVGVARSLGGVQVGVSRQRSSGSETVGDGAGGEDEDLSSLRNVYRDADRRTLNLKYVDMFNTLVMSVSDPTEMHRKLIELAPMHREKGAVGKHMERLHKAMIHVLDDTLDEEWGKDEEDAWNWFFDFLTRSFEQGINEAGEPGLIVQQSWDLLLEITNVEDFGGFMFDTLFELAPNCDAFRGYQKQVIAPRLVEMVSSLVNLAQSAERDAEEHATWFGLRQLSYGVQKAHVPLIREVLLVCLRAEIGKEIFSKEVEESWQAVWEARQGIIMQTIEDGEAHGHVALELVKSVKQRCTSLAKGKCAPEDVLGEYLAQELKKEAPEIGAIFGVIRRKAIDKKLFRSSAKLDRDRDVLHMASEMKVANTGEWVVDELTKQARQAAVVALGREVWLLLSNMTQLVPEPDRQQQRLLIHATGYFQLGLRTWHVESFGNAIESALKVCLAEAWEEKQGEAFRWMWGLGSEAITGVLESYERNHKAQAQKQWEDIRRRNTDAELGAKFYTALSETAPDLLHLFRRPRQMHAHAFLSMVDILVECGSPTEALYEEFRNLSVRHIKYRVTPDQLRPFGKAVFRVLEQELGEAWIDGAASWTCLWNRASSSLRMNLALGSNLITLALVKGDTEKFEQAISDTPRCLRAEMLCEVDVIGLVDSPLRWALEDGKLGIAKFIINDCLAIRADSERYYYGRETIWKTHPKIVRMLLKACPDLLEDFLNGHLWHSQLVQKGKMRANYYIRELYGEPDVVADPWEAPLAVLTRQSDAKIFRHPVIETLLDIKWTHIGRPYFFLTEVMLAVMLGFFMMGHVIYQNSCDFLGVRLFVVLFASCGLLIQVVGSMWQYYLGQLAEVKILGVNLPRVPRFLSNVYNVMRLTAFSILMLSLFVDPCIGHSPGPDGRKYLDDVVEKDPDEPVAPSIRSKMIAAVALLLWVQLLQGLIFSNDLAAFTYTIASMIKDVSSNLLVIGIFMMGFTSALCSLRENGFEDFNDAFVIMLKEVLYIDTADYPTISTLGNAIIIACTIVITIGMLNILIAQLSQTFYQLSEDKVGFAMKHRANLTAEYECFLPFTWRKAVFDKLNLYEKLEFDIGDRGPSGGVQKLHTADLRNTKQYIPDRIMRFTGESNKMMPWPKVVESEEDLQPTQRTGA